MLQQLFIKSNIRYYIVHALAFTMKFGKFHSPNNPVITVLIIDRLQWHSFHSIVYAKCQIQICIARNNIYLAK